MFATDPSELTAPAEQPDIQVQEQNAGREARLKGQFNKVIVGVGWEPVRINPMVANGILDPDHKTIPQNRALLDRRPARPPEQKSVVQCRQIIAALTTRKVDEKAAFKGGGNACKGHQ